MIEEVEAVLAAMGGQAEFAVEESFSSRDIDLRVEGVGRVSLPLTPARARKLVAAGRPAPFGIRDETRFDDTVRSTWEIAASRVSLGDAFAAALAPKLDVIRRRLGLPHGTVLRAEPDKLLVYGPGQFFAPHRDSERSDDMVGTLVLELPSRYAGGQLVVKHGGKKRAFGGGGGSASLVAFYGDCVHEVEPIDAGHRVTLTFHLLREGAAARGGTKHVDRVESVIREYFARPVPARGRHEASAPPDRLVYLLDHDYTQKSLGWSHLKGKDETRVAALLAVADRLNCEAALALADVHEQWTTAGDDWSYRGNHDESDDGNDGDSAELDELLESDVVLRHFLGRSGKPLRGLASNIDDGEVCSTRPTVDGDPFKSEHEGWMGNYGNTADRWYHRAALVLWPRDRDFTVRAKAAPAWAIGEVGRLVKTGKREEALRNGQQLATFWRSVLPPEQPASLVASTLKVAEALGDPSLATELVGPLRPTSIGKLAAPALGRVVVRFGFDWSRSLFDTWRARVHRNSASGVFPGLATVVEALVAHAPSAGPRLAAWLVEQEIEAFRDRTTRLRGGFERRDSKYAREALLRDLEQLFGAAALDGPMSLASITDFLMDEEQALPPLLLGEILETKRARPLTKTLQPHLKALRTHAAATVRAVLARPIRNPGDWSIAAPAGCACRLCGILVPFLTDSKTETLRWPLAKEGRQHIHSILDRHELPVEHTTIRIGSPQTLVLRKTSALFDGEKATRAKLGSLLRRIEGARDTA